MAIRVLKLYPPGGTALPGPIKQFGRADVLLEVNGEAGRILGKIKGRDFVGKDEFGRATVTKPPCALKMETGRTLGVVVEFKIIGNAPISAFPAEISLEYFKGRKEGNVLKCKTDVLKAVRALKWVREWHENEPDLKKAGYAENVAYGWLRECSLRAMRDAMLEIAIGGWAADLKKFGYAKVNAWYNDFCNYKRVASALEFSRDMRERFGNIGETNGQGELCSYAESRLMQQIKKTIENLPDNRNAEEVRKRLVNAGRLVSSRLLKAANQQLFEASESIGRCKPWWVAMELEKTGDMYTSGICADLNKVASVLFGGRKIPAGIEILQGVAGKLRELKPLEVE